MQKKMEYLLAVHGQAVQDQPVAFRLSYSNYKTANDNQQKNKTSPASSLSKPASNRDNENASMRLYHQVSRNVNGLNKSPVKGSLSTSFSLPMESERSISTPLVLEDSLRREISAAMKSHPHSRNSRVIDLTNSFDTLNTSSTLPLKPPTAEAEDAFQQQSFLEPSSEFEQKIFPRNSQTKINGFQHIANLGNRHRYSDGARESEYGEETDRSSERFYEYKSPFSEEYDQAIAYQAQLSGNANEWNLKDFYRDVRTPLESGTNSKSVFEKCLKLSRLQASTIKWEQRRRQNLHTYNRLLKNPSFESSNNLFNIPANLSEIKRELRCPQCKHVACLGNCAPGQEYHQYKRFIPLTSLPTTREQLRSKLGLRSQRSMLDIRPRSEQTNFSPIVVVPLFDEETTTKSSSKKLAHGFFSGRSFRQPKRDPMTFVSSNKIFS